MKQLDQSQWNLRIHLDLSDTASQVSTQPSQPADLLQCIANRRHPTLGALRLLFRMSRESLESVASEERIVEHEKRVTGFDRVGTFLPPRLLAVQGTVLPN